MNEYLEKLSSFLYRLTRPLWEKILSDSHRTRVIIVCEDRVLLVKKWLSSGKWEFPGGGIQNNETLEEAAVREVREEVGIILSPKELVNMGSFDIEQTASSFTIELFAEAVSSTGIKTRFWEISQAKWFPISKLPSDRLDFVETSVGQWRNL